MRISIFYLSSFFIGLQSKLECVEYAWWVSLIFTIAKLRHFPLPSNTCPGFCTVMSGILESYSSYSLQFSEDHTVIGGRKLV